MDNHRGTQFPKLRPLILDAALDKIEAQNQIWQQGYDAGYAAAYGVHLEADDEWRNEYEAR
jgi:hypothetical protein